MPNFNSMLIFLAMIVACFADMSHKNTEKDAKSEISAATQRVVNATKHSNTDTSSSGVQSTKSISMDLTPPKPSLLEKNIHNSQDMMKQAEKQDSSPSKDLKVDESIGFGFYAGIGSPFGYRSYYPSYYPYYRPYYYRPYWRYPYYGSYFG